MGIEDKMQYCRYLHKLQTSIVDVYCNVLYILRKHYIVLGNAGKGPRDQFITRDETCGQKKFTGGASPS